MKNKTQALLPLAIVSLMIFVPCASVHARQGNAAQRVRQCATFSGSGAAQLARCLADIPAAGGYADSRDAGALAWDSCPFDGIAKPVTLELGVGTIQLRANCTVPASVHLVLGRGSVISIAEGFTLVYGGGLTADDSPHFTGSGTLTFRSTSIARYSPTWTGALCNGSGDDAQALNRLVAAMEVGGNYSFPPGATCRVTSATVSLSRSNLVVEGNGAEILYEPSSPASGNDRAILVHTGDSNLGKPIYITRPIGMGDTGFEVMSNSGLTPGDWIFVYETDPGTKPREEIVIADWAQVDSVAGTTTVKVNRPFRQVFPGTHSSPRFFKISNLVENVTIRDLRCRTSSSQFDLPCFFAGVARNVTLENTQASARRGNPFASYRTNGLRIQGRATRAVGPSTEFASTSDLVVDNLVVLSDGMPARSASLVLDYGTAFFSVIAPQLVSPVNFGIGLWSGVYNGSILGANVSYVQVDGVPNSGCISLLGAQRVHISNNTCIGGLGPASVGINIGNTSGLRMEIPSQGNVIANNIVSNFVFPYGAVDCNNTYLIPNGSPGEMRVPCKFQFGEAGTPQTLVGIKSNVQADLPIRWERPGGSTWYAGPDYSVPGRFTIAVDSAGTPVLQVDSSGFLYRKPILAAELLANAATDGAEAYCSDCVTASVCAGGGTGAFARRVSGRWVCN